MLFLLSLVVRVLARLLVLSATDEATKDLEILVLQQQLCVLRRQARRPRFTALDRVLLAAASRALPRQRRTARDLRKVGGLRHHLQTCPLHSGHFAAHPLGQA